MTGTLPGTSTILKLLVAIDITTMQWEQCRDTVNSSGLKQWILQWTSILRPHILMILTTSTTEKLWNLFNQSYGVHIRVETGSGQPGHILSGLSGCDPVYKISS